MQIPFAILLVLLGLTGAFFIPTEKRLGDAAEAGVDAPAYQELSRRHALVAPSPPGSCSWPSSSWPRSWAPDCTTRRRQEESRGGGSNPVAMADPRAQRTLVKSPPELWAMVSDNQALGRHLEPFGEIRITRLEPETTVAWEGDRACGTVELEASGWGTRVTLTARTPDDDRAQAAHAPEAVEIMAAVDAVEAAEVAETAEADAATTEIAAQADEPGAPSRRRWWQRLFSRRSAADADAGAPRRTRAPGGTRTPRRARMTRTRPRARTPRRARTAEPPSPQRPPSTWPSRCRSPSGRRPPAPGPRLLLTRRAVAHGHRGHPHRDARRPRRRAPPALQPLSHPPAFGAPRGG